MGQVLAILWPLPAWFQPSWQRLTERKYPDNWHLLWQPYHRGWRLNKHRHDTLCHRRGGRQGQRWDAGSEIFLAGEQEDWANFSEIGIPGSLKQREQIEQQGYIFLRSCFRYFYTALKKIRIYGTYIKSQISLLRYQGYSGWFQKWYEHCWGILAIWNLSIIHFNLQRVWSSLMFLQLWCVSSLYLWCEDL